MSVVDDIRDKLDIVEVISGYVPLRKAGRNFKARCPFHTEKTPSFTVSPERQTWRCFGACATGGDIFNFVMRKDNVEFGEALRRLAETAGVEVSTRPKEQVDLEESLFRVNQEAARFYNEMLMSPEGRAALKYLNDRSIDAKAIEEFQLGYSPKGRGRLKTHLATLDANLGHATQAGLLRSDDEGNVRDFFFGRLMVPILDRRGRVAGFGGRSLDGSNPKYINTPATPIFDKQATLYALDKAASAIREQETAVIVEGYMDVIAAHQHGRKNVVASMGTALTERQIYLVRSLTKTVVLALDADAAGQEATLRSIEASWRAMERRRFGQRQEVALRIAVLPEGSDPDDIIRESVDRWDEIVKSSVPYMDFVIPAMARRHDLSTPQGKGRAAEALMPIILSMGNAFEQDRYFGQLADTLEVTRDQLQASIGKLRPAARERRPAGPQPGARPSSTTVSPLASGDRDPLEEFVLKALLHWPELLDVVEDHTPEEFRRTENRELFTQLLAAGTIDELQRRLDESLAEHFTRLTESDIKPTTRQSAPRAIQDALGRLKQRHLRDRQAEILESLDIEPGAELPKDIEDSIASVNDELKEGFLVGAREKPRR
ncbi:MAG: DNA primase [Dehalococcoidia bacterium]|nr:DNA primase [Dehalococcoidia bacterium]